MDKRSHYLGSLSPDETAVWRENGLLPAVKAEGFLPVMAGGVTSYGDAVTNPLAGPTVSGTTLTIDFLLANPTRVTRMLADLVMRNFFLDKVFQTGGDVSGGAVLYDQASVIDVYTDRDVERVEPGAEFPIVTGARIAPLVALVEKFGGKFPVTDEAKRRNDTARIANQMRRLANTITRKMQQRGIIELENAVTAYSRKLGAGEAKAWEKATEEALLNRVPKKSPLTTFLKAIEALEVLEMGYTFNTLIVHPKDRRLLLEYYSADTGRLDAALSSVGIETIISTPRKASGSAFITAGTQVGQMRLEEPMRTVTEREGAPSLREQTWIQSAVNPVFFVTDPYAVLEINELS